MREYSLETLFKVWDDSTGCRYEVGPDADGLDCIELRSVDKKGNIDNRFVIDPDAAPLVYEALGKLIQGGDNDPSSD